MTKHKTIYQNQYISEHYDRINLVLQAGYKDQLKAVASSSGQSVNSYILDAIRAYMKPHNH